MPWASSVWPTPYLGVEHGRLPAPASGRPNEVIQSFWSVMCEVIVGYVVVGELGRGYGCWYTMLIEGEMMSRPPLADSSRLFLHPLFSSETSRLGCMW